MTAWKAVVAAVMISLAGAAYAKDDKPCASGMVCASQPDTVFAALQRAGHKPKFDKDSDGDPSLSGEAAGNNFDVLFYGCEAHAKCDSLQFRLTFSPYQNHSIDLANLWNRQKRFLKAETRDDKKMAFNYDLSTAGGLTQANFADVLGWWDTMLGEVNKFFEAHPAGDKIGT